MPTLGPIQNIQANSVTNLTPPNGLSVGQMGEVVIYNSTASELQVSASGKRYLLEPLTADKFDLDSDVNVSVFPSPSVIATGAYIGTIRAVWAVSPDEIPGVFPLPLPPFPGGSSLIATGVTSTATETIAPPSGTGTLIISSVRGLSDKATITQLAGVQTGTVYASAESGTPISVDVTDVADSTFLLAGGGGPNYSIFAVPAQPPPTFPTTAVSETGTATPLPAPQSGAYYLFGLELNNGNNGTGIELHIESPAGSIVGLVAVPEAINGFAYAETNLNGLRVTGAVKFDFVTGSGAGLAVLRYAPGP